MAEKFARVAFVNNASGARLDGEFIADTGPTWLVKPSSGQQVQVLQKTEWTSVPTSPAGAGRFDDIFSGMFGAR